MKTILVDAVNTLIIKDSGMNDEMYQMLENFDNKKIIVSNANDEEIVKFGMDDLPYELFTLKHDPNKTDPKFFKELMNKYDLTAEDLIYFEHNPEAIKSAESVGIKTCYYDKEKKDINSLRSFLEESL